MIDLFFSMAPIADKVVIGILLVFSVLVLGISLERLIVLRPLYRKSRQAQQKLTAFFESGDLNLLEELAKDTSHPGGLALKYGLLHIQKKGALGVDELFKAVYLQTKPKLEGRIPILATIGSNAPFIGLLGTVFGIMRSFHDLSGAMESATQQTVMAGISIALLATAMGLAVAIPSVMLYNYFQRRITSILETVENVGSACLSSSSYWVASQKKGQ